MQLESGAPKIQMLCGKEGGDRGVSVCRPHTPCKMGEGGGEEQLVKGPKLPKLNSLIDLFVFFFPRKKTTMEISHIFFLSQKETPSDVMLHLAALRGDVVELRRVLDTGKVHVDCKDEVSMIYICM